MSRFNRLFAAVAGLMLCGSVLPQPSQAAIEGTSGQVADLRAPATRGAATATADNPVKGRAGSRNVLRCWQFGRMIYEGQGVLQSDKAAFSMKVAGGGSVHLMDMQNAACILEQSGG